MLASLGVGGGICCRPEGYRGRLGPSSKNLTTMKLISQPSREVRQMVQCLELYYKQGRSQKDIAVALGVSAATVSRLLKRAMDDGLVRAELGAAAADYFEKIAENGMRIGLSCGFTLYHTIHSLRERRFRDLALYPLSGESTLKLVDIFANTLVGMMAAKYRPHVRAYALPVQHLLSLKAIERERRRLLRDPEVRSIYDAAQDVDVALVGVGVIAEQTPGFCSLAESYGVSVKRLRQLGVVGEINYQPFDAEGRVVDRPELRALSRRLLSVEGDRLQALSRRDDRYVIAVSGGKAKVDALRGALAGRFLNVLVTDEDAAIALLRR